VAAILPQVLTTMNLASGFFAIVAASSGHFGRAALAIIFAGIFDALDGRVARLANATSRFGVEYDSIADTVSFGVAPAVLAFYAGHLADLGWSGWVMAFIYTACAALRLARFNVTPGRFVGRFEGLPSPAGAGMVVATALFGEFLSEQGIGVFAPAWLLGLGVAAVGLLMVSQIPYLSFKHLNPGHGQRVVVLVVIAFAVILLLPGVTLFLIGLAYLASGPVEAVWRRRTGRELIAIDPGGESAREAGEETHP
jgi:CDP-diacylglycerol--serine O-phosphatidyltransferase